MSFRDSDTNQSINKRENNYFVRKMHKIGRKFFSFFKLIFIGNTLPQNFFRLYFIIIAISSVLLWCPFSHEVTSTKQITIFDAIFIACSAFSNTGLSPVPINENLSIWGKIILVIDMEVGCLGAAAIIYCLWIFFRQKLDRKYKANPLILNVLQSERGGTNLYSAHKIVAVSMLSIVIAQLIFAFLYSFIFCFLPAYKQTVDHVTQITYDTEKMLPQFKNYGLSLWVGLFTSVSAMGNAGFEIISNWSVAPYRNDWGTLLQFLLIFELTIGGLGPVVIFDIYEKIKMRRKNLTYNMTLFAKISLWTYFIVSFLTIVFSFLCEILNRSSPIWTCANEHKEFGNAILYNKCMCLIYNVLDTRCLGMSTIAPHALSEPTKWLYILSMFIGGSPASTAGGIRTTTIAIVCITLFAKILGRDKVILSNHKLDEGTIKDAFIVLFASELLIVIGSFVIWSSIPALQSHNFTITDIVFEIMSAFGTVGLSFGITSVVKWWGLLYLILLMFIGQLGVLSTITVTTKKNTHFNELDYPIEEVKVA